MKQIPSKTPKAIITDVDKTLTEERTWYYLTEQLGGDVQGHAKLYTDYLSNVISYDDMKKGLFKIWLANGKIHKNKLTQIFDSVRYRGEAFATFSQLQEKGYTLCLISSSIDMFIESVAKRFNIDYWYANSKFIFDKDGYWVDFNFDKEMAKLKVTQLENFLKKTGFAKDECIAIGDDSNDIDLFGEIPGIAVNSNNDDLLQLAWEESKYLPRVIQIIESI